MNEKVSVIIPVYNQEDVIERCINSLKKQSIGFENLQVLLIDDGSKDSSAAICRALCGRYNNISYFYQENSGVSSARNKGISSSIGKYIFYLDADDELSADCIEKVSTFFDSVYDETDLVTYKIETIYKGKKLEPHFRYRFLKESGVYDLNEYAYIGQTTMNIAVKNRFEENVLFDESQTFSEDQKYCCRILSQNLKMGFCSSGEYIYYRSSESSSGRMAGACFIFEQSMKMFEELFAPYERVPAAFQGLYVNDVYWKLLSNILLPWHYKGEEYEKAVGRIRALLEKCDVRVILNHPNMDFFEKFYLIRLKDPAALSPYVQDGFFGLRLLQENITAESSMELVITRIRVCGESLEIQGFMKSVFFQFYNGNPLLCAAENDGFITKKLSLFESAHSYYLCHEKTQRFKAFRYRANLNEVKNVSFKTCLMGCWFPVHFYFMPRVPFSFSNGSLNVRYMGADIALSGTDGFSFSKASEEKKELWLYYDCAGVGCDNGLLQFLYDIKKDDGIERYYVVTDERQHSYLERAVFNENTAEKSLSKGRTHDSGKKAAAGGAGHKGFSYRSEALKAGTVSFGSRKHRRLLERCTKVLTAYIEESNILPYSAKEIEKRSGRFQFETIYLQHGVLHIIMPWKYSPEKIMADKVVVSVKEEKRLFMENGFKEEDLIECAMARFETLDKTLKKGHKILFAPSWRSYLAGEYKNHRWEVSEKKLKSSSYFKGIESFLESGELSRILKESGWQLDVKLHPIFEEYAGLLKFNTPEICPAPPDLRKEEYSLFITDFSSFAYDFLYLETDVIHYIPDINEFLCGMNGYRQLNYPEAFWERAAYTPAQLTGKIADFIAGKQRCTDECTFFPLENPARQLYEKLTGAL